MKDKYERELTGREKRKLKFKILWTTLGVEVVLFSLLLIFYCMFYMNNKMDEINYTDLKEEDLSINEGLSTVTTSEYTTIALFGIDARDVTTDEGNRCDTIIVASINNKTKEVKLMSVYRDTFVQFAGTDSPYNGCYTKVTHTYAFGGAKGAVSTLNRNLDLQITDYVTVNFLSLADIVDDLGGITVNVTPEEMESVNIWLPETADIAGRSYQGLYQTGDVTLDGLQAVTYCRIRNIGAGDIDRSARQREVIAAILDKAKQSDIKTLNNILDDVLPEISTSLSKKDILTLMAGVFDYELVANEGFPFTYHAGMYYDEIAGQDLSIVVAGDLQYNVELAHKFLYDATLESDYNVTAPVGDGTITTAEDGSVIETPSTDVPASTPAVDPDKLYTPSLTMQSVNDALHNKTGVYKPDDPEFRGQY